MALGSEAAAGRYAAVDRAAGLTAERAAAIVQQMTGPYRLPDALRRVDTLSRTTTFWT